MTLRRKMGLQISAMIVGLLLVSVSGLWGLNGLQTDYGLALAGYDYARGGYEVGTHLASAKMMLRLSPPQRGLAQHEVETAAEKFRMMQAGTNRTFSRRAAFPQDQLAVADVHESIAAAIKQLAGSPGDRPIDQVISDDDAAVNLALNGIRAYTADIRAAVESYQRAADAKRHLTLLVISLVCSTIVVCGVVLGILQYRGVVKPLRHFNQAVQRVAAAQFTQRIDERGPDEFAALARDFNRMAQELDDFYHQLEAKVTQKSKELLRSERLASLGYLAAGVAHEINNPLGIIAGYAEYSLDQIKRRSADAQSGDAELIQSLQVICDEAFRCKDITSKLLALARQGDEDRRAVCLPDIADRVVSIIGGLRAYRDRTLTVATEPQPPREQLCVSAVEAQMQQVVLNLTLNALEATVPQTGQVRIDLGRRNGAVELCVSDNGRGMTPQTLGHVFEPFFTDKRGSRQAGTGLGLSITHRIIESHGGTITAHSDGPGKGSRFVVSLPAIASTENQS
jgi:two-component system, NtrC family, sensor kinase